MKIGEDLFQVNAQIYVLIADCRLQAIVEVFGSNDFVRSKSSARANKTLESMMPISSHEMKSSE